MLARASYLQLLVLLGRATAQDWNGWSPNGQVVRVTVTNTHYTCPCDGSTNGPVSITTTSTSTPLNTLTSSRTTSVTSPTSIVSPVSTTTSSSTASATSTTTSTTTTSTSSSSVSQGPVSTTTSSSTSTSTTSTTSSTTSTSTSTSTTTTTSTSTSTTVLTTAPVSTSTSTSTSTTTTTTTTLGTVFRLRAAGSTLVPDGRYLSLNPDQVYDDGQLAFNPAPVVKRDDSMALARRQGQGPGSYFTVTAASELVEISTGYVLAADPTTTDTNAMMVSRACLAIDGYVACACAAPVDGTAASCSCGAGATKWYVEADLRLFISTGRAANPGQYDTVQLTIQFG